MPAAIREHGAQPHPAQGRSEDAAFASLARAAAGGQAAVLLEAMAQATAYPELGGAIGQCRAWITLMEERWKAALARADEAISQHDVTSASALLGEVPADPARC